MSSSQKVRRFNSKHFLLSGGSDEVGDLPAVDFERALRTCPQDRPPLAPPPTVPLNFASPTTMRGPLFFIFTSGTTGLPKAAIVSHVRYFFMAMNVNLFFGVTAKDCLYTALPLYHTAGGILGTGQVTLAGASMVVKKKFSASRFWRDCTAHRCTVSYRGGEGGRGEGIYTLLFG